MQYNRLGLYIERKKKAKLGNEEKNKKIDWTNVILFVALFFSVLMFLVF